MADCIISTAQHARPKVIHMSEPVRAQLMRSSVAVTRKPLSASSSFIARKAGSSAPTGLPVRGSRMPRGAGAITCAIGGEPEVNPMRSIPFQGSLFPFVDEADGEHEEEDDHRPEAEGADFPEG